MINKVIIFYPAENDKEADINGRLVLGYVKNINENNTIDIDIFVGEDNLLRLSVKHKEDIKRKSDEAYYLTPDEAVELLTLEAVIESTKILEDAEKYVSEIIEAAKIKAGLIISTTKDLKKEQV